MKNANHNVSLTSNLLQMKSEGIHDWFRGSKHGNRLCSPGCSYSRWRSGQSLPDTPAFYVSTKPD